MSKLDIFEDAYYVYKLANISSNKRLLSKREFALVQIRNPHSLIIEESKQYLNCLI